MKFRKNILWSLRIFLALGHFLTICSLPACALSNAMLTRSPPDGPMGEKGFNASAHSVYRVSSRIVNWGGGGGSSISATVQPPTLHEVGGGGDYASTDLIGPGQWGAPGLCYNSWL